MNGLTRVREPEDEQVVLRLDPVQHHPDFAEIHLGLSARGVFLRDEYLHSAPASRSIWARRSRT